MGVPQFVHLTCKSSFSLLEGMVPVKKLAKAMGKGHFAAAAVTDLGNLFGAVEVSKYFAPEGVQPILGCELPIVGLEQEGGRLPPVGFVTLLVRNEEGWRHLARLVSESQERKLAAGDAGIALERVAEL